MDALAQLTAALTGRYTVDREIGRGGMATVYLARDVRHNRKVALKVLDPELGAVLGVERFLSEIEVTANLQHPNLLPLFDSGEANGLLFYVMPFVEGESLRATIEREKQLSVDDAVRVATAVASALDYAHRHGVIHRDLKPENILMHDGQPVVADFGIALAVSKAGGNRITQTGLSLGTPQYMSPEQATGDREIDGRTDIYSLAAVTYEMLIGEPPHDGKTSQAIIARILTDRPRSMRVVRDTVPPHVDAAVLQALSKLPADRFRTAHEFADALSTRTATAASPLPVATVPSEARSASVVSKAVPWAIAVVAMVVAIAGWRKSSRGSDGEAPVLRYEVSLPTNADVTRSIFNVVAIAPDARAVAYIASRPDGIRRILVRTADDLQPREVAGTEGALFATFSPDGSALAFVRGDQLLKVPMAGGKVDILIESVLGIGIRGVTWSPSGWIIASSGNTLGKIPALGGRADSLTRANTALGETGQHFPVALADGKTVLYASIKMGGAANARIAVASIADGSTTILDLQGSYPLGVVDGHLIYATVGGTIMAAPFEVATRRLTGPAFALSDQAAINGPYGLTYANMALDGSLVYASGAVRRQPVAVSPDGVARTFGEPGAYSWPRLSPDGKRLALSVGSLLQRDVWLVQLPAGQLTRLTTGGAINDRPEWTADGRFIVFRSKRSGRYALWTQPVDGGDATQLFGLANSEIDEGVLSPDGEHLIVQRDTVGQGEVWVRAMHGDTTLRRVPSGPFGAYGGRFSADGKWIVYTSTETGAEEVYVRPFPSIGRQLQVSLGGGGAPVWSRDGKRIYYVNGQQLMVAAIGGTDPFTIASRSMALSRGYSFFGVHADYDVAPDGTIIAFQSPNENPRLIVVKNLASEIRARVRGSPK